MSYLNEPGPTSDDQEQTLTRLFEEFLDADTDVFNYQEDIVTMLEHNRHRLIVNLDHLRAYKAELADNLLNQPVEYFFAFEKALVEVISRGRNDKEKRQAEQEGYHIGLSGSFGDHHVSPRTLRAAQLGKMISLEGIVTRCSLVRPKLVTSVHYCAKTRQFLAHDYRDALNSTPNKPPTSSVTPQKDDDGNLLETEYGYCTFRDNQRISIQEMPERSPAGQLPRSTDVILDDDLVDKCKPGDRIQLVGMYRSVGGGANGAFKSLIVANNINLLSTKIGGGIAETELTVADIRLIRSIGTKRKDVFTLLSQSLAPSIFGHKFIKEAVVLLLLGGLEKNLPNGTHIRGDINVLMVGDPSTAKSQMLRFVLGTAPLAIATTGRGSSGVGLTAAVTMDKDTGERRLEAGAMVLADRGVVCIDEFDKMSDIDRVAIHEVMEQQTVTIAKAGIHTTLNARCSVIAAANPIYGQYDVHKDPHKNIALPDSLLSRFDLLFVVTDDVDETRDRRIADHVLRMHRYLPPGVEEGTPVADSLTQQLSIDGPGVATDTVDDDGELTAFEKYDPLIHVGIGQEDRPFVEEGRRATRRATRASTRQPQVLSIAFIKKYIQYAKKLTPRLTKEAADYIVQVYSKLRNEHLEGNQRRTSPLTARTLETLIRLATAHAKARLSKSVDEEDAQKAEEILTFALYKEILKRSRKKAKGPRPTPGGGPGDEEEEEVEEEDGSSDDEGGGAQENGVRMEDPRDQGRNNVGGPGTNAPAAAGTDWEDDNDMRDVEMEVDPGPVAAAPLNGAPSVDDRLMVFRGRFSSLLATELADEELWVVADLVASINRGLSEQHRFDGEEALVMLRRMTDADEVMLAEDTNLVYKIA